MFKPRTANTSENKSSSSNSFLGVQAKLNIGKSDDKYEREADRMADKVVNKSGVLGAEAFISPSPKVQKKGADEQEVQKQEETEQIQEKPLLNEITPLVQRKEEEVQEKSEEPEIQEKQEEEQVQTQLASEEEVQQKSEEEEVQTSLEEEPVQTKSAGEEEIQEKEANVQLQETAAESEELQQKSEEEEVQTSLEEESVQQKVDTDIQAKLDGDRAAEKRVQRKEEEIQEKEEELQEKEEDEVQKKSAGNGGDTSNLEKNLASSKGGGSPMDANTRGQMESGFGTDFSGVRIHNDSNAVQMNKELGAQAFTNGNDIYFNEGKYNPSSKNGQHLLAHELTHTVQQGASTQPAVQKAAAAPVPADAPPLRPTVPLDITHRLNVTGEWAKYLDAEYEKKKGPIDVEVKIGERFSGTIELSRKKGTDEGELAKYEITRGTKKKYLKINGWNFLQPLRDAGAEPVLVLNNFGDEQATTGFLSVAIKEVAVGNAKGFIDSLNENLDKMGFLGVSPITIADGFVNEFSAGRLVFQVGSMKTVVDGYLEAGGGMGITGDVFTFNVNANIDVAGLASGEFMIARGEDGSFSGTADIEADIANVNAKLHVEYIDGTVTIQGTGRIQSEKFSGEITLLVTDAERSKQMMHAALGVESMDAEKEQAESPAAPVPKSKGNQVLAGWGEITANITPWLSGTAKVGIDAEGHVTIVGEITVPQEVELMEQRGKKVDIFKVEIRAGYGIPLVGQVFLFASIGMFMNAGFGPLVLKGVGFKGTYSTDPSVLQEFEITGTLNINAFAILGLEAEAGVGVTILGHDLKAGVNVTAAAGLRAYAEATPTLQYKEQAAPEGGKIGETRLKGHFEAAAQLFMQLSGSLFYEIDSPWWSPAPDGREDFPLGEVQYPIGDSMGIGADMDWLVGSPEIPELKFSPVEFDADKFTADVMADPPPRKMGKSDEEKAGEWVDGNKPSDQQANPETKDGEGLPDTGKAKEDLKKLPDEQKYMRALDEMAKLEKADPKPTFAVVKAKADKVKAKYGLDQIKATDKGDIGEVFVKHAKQDNKKHLLEVPMMSAAERYKLLKKAMDDLKARNKKAGGEKGTITQADAEKLITDWQKAHPVVEETRVVDGTETWDYFIDIGDKSETERGLVKADSKPEVSPEDKKKHVAIIDEIKGELSAPTSSKPTNFTDFYNAKKKQAKELEAKHQPKLKKGINLTINFGDLKTEQKDQDIDFKIKIAPNTSEGETVAKYPVVYDTQVKITLPSGKEMLLDHFEENDKKILARIRQLQYKALYEGGVVEKDKHMSGNLATGRLVLAGMVPDPEYKGDHLEENKVERVLTIPIVKTTADELVVFISSSGSFDQVGGAETIKNTENKLGSGGKGRITVTVKAAGEDGTGALSYHNERVGEGLPIALFEEVSLTVHLVQADALALQKQIFEAIDKSKEDYQYQGDQKKGEFNAQAFQHSEQAIYLALKKEDARIASEIQQANITNISDIALHVHTERDMCRNCALTGHQLHPHLSTIAPRVAAELQARGTQLDKLKMLVTSTVKGAAGHTHGSSDVDKLENQLTPIIQEKQIFELGLGVSSETPSLELFKILKEFGGKTSNVRLTKSNARRKLESRAKSRIDSSNNTQWRIKVGKEAELKEILNQLQNVIENDIYAKIEELEVQANRIKEQIAEQKKSSNISHKQTTQTSVELGKPTDEELEKIKQYIRTYQQTGLVDPNATQSQKNNGIMNRNETVLDHINYLLSIKDYKQVEHLLEVEYAAQLDVEIGLRLANFYLSLSRLNEAQYTFDKICNNSPGERDAMIGFGSIYTLKGEYPYARDFFESFLETFKDDSHAQLEFAEATIRMNNLDEGLILLNKCEPDDIINDKVKFLSGVYLRKRGKYSEALSILKKINYSEVETKLEMITCYFSLENFSSFSQLIHEMMETHSNHPKVRYWRCRELIQLKKLDQALELALHIREDYQLYYVQSLIGDIKFAQGDFRSAKRFYMGIPISTPWYGEGLGKYYWITAHIELTNADRSEMLSSSKKPEKRDMLFYIGNYFMEIEKNLEMAQFYFETSLRELPEHVPTLQKLVITLDEIGEHNKALDLCKRILSLNPSHEWAKDRLEIK